MIDLTGEELRQLIILITADIERLDAMMRNDNISDGNVNWLINKKKELLRLRVKLGGNP